MARGKILLQKDKVLRLYRKRRLSTQRVADLLSCSQGTVINRLREWGVKARDKAQMRIQYEKQPFSGDQREKAYLLGFRLGDLNVYKPKGNSKILVVRCHTTIQEQARLVKSLFVKYGGVKICNSLENGFTINCFVDDSFQFLYSKSLPKWVFKNRKTAISFIAGYTDAEGSFGLNQGRGRFKIDAYDYEILEEINSFLGRSKIFTKFYCIARKDTFSISNGIWNDNLWRLNVNVAGSLEKFIVMILPYLKHKTRIKDAKRVLNNIYIRRNNGTIR